MDLGIDGLGEATEIGIGASAIVYRAAQRGGGEVAVKVLVPSDEKFVRGFEREAVLLARLSRSPHIVSIHDTGVTSSGQPYLVLELCRGSLLDRIKLEQRIDPTEAVRIMAGVAAGVADAHELGVVHRDLKPGNILISSTGHYLVTDFGTSVITGATTLQTSSVSFTAGYVAPETVMDSSTSYPVDVYALGATLFHMVSGSAPFLSANVGSNIVALATRVVNDPVPDLRPLGVPDALCRLIERTMAKDPAARPTISQLRMELEALGRAGSLIEAEPAAAHDRPRGILLDSEPTSAPSSVSVLAPPIIRPENRSFAPLEPTRWGVVSETMLRRLRPRHLLVGASAVLVLGVAVGLAFGFFDRPLGDGELSSEVAAPVNSIAAPDADLVEIAESGSGTGSAAGADPRGLDLVDDGVITTTTEADPDTVPSPAPTRPPAPDPNAGTVVVPSVVGLGEVEARAALVAAGLVAGTSSLVFSPTVPAGLVVGVSEAGRIDEGTIVNLVLSKGPAVTLPDLLALTEAAAIEQLTLLGLTATTATIEGSAAPPGSVVSMDPAPGTEVRQGSAVALGIAAEILPTVPQLAGLELGPARTLLAEAGLELGAVTRIHDDQADGLILSSTPTTGTSVTLGTTVDVVVSLGPEPDPCDGLVGRTRAAAVAAVAAAGLESQLAQGFSETRPQGTVMACENTPPSDVVLLTISQGPLNPVPDVVGLRRPRAQLELIAAGMTFTVTTVFSAEPVGIVTATNPRAGAHYAQGTTVNVSVSKGPDPGGGSQ